MAHAGKKAQVKDFTILRSPIVTEKTAGFGRNDATSVSFEVEPTADKLEIKRAIERVFNVEVDCVRTINMRGKMKRTTRNTGYTAASKKAYVTLKPGFSIDLVDGI